MKNIWRLNTFHSYLMRDNSSNEFLCWNGNHSNKHERLFASQLLPNLLSSSTPSPTSTGEGEEQSTITSTPTIAVYEEGKEGEKFWEKMMNNNNNNNKEYFSTASKLRGEPRLFLISIGSGTVKVNNNNDDIYTVFIAIILSFLSAFILPISFPFFDCTHYCYYHHNRLRRCNMFAKIIWITTTSCF